MTLQGLIEYLHLMQESLVSWIPSFDAAAALNEMRKSNEEVLHLVSPNLVPWRTFLEVFSKALGVPLVPYETWLKAMEDDLADPTRSEVEAMIHNPGLRLLPFYRHSKPNEDGEPLGLVRLDVTKAKQVAPSLNQVKMTSEWVDKWIGYWRSSGFLPPKESTGL
ncbi:hypothetical protein NLI96_g5500 [Meripilus lineatus]|uniref:Uncharacterized protein n=1 Tax=Meripilus lineatus TaxID=2056292 RepID=A0AAD5YDU5_9APHY|nr:hypothetical protein NLI96_g5500 [Physisporinus lineatus]